MLAGHYGKVKHVKTKDQLLSKCDRNQPHIGVYKMQAYLFDVQFIYRQLSDACVVQFINLKTREWMRVHAKLCCKQMPKHELSWQRKSLQIDTKHMGVIDLSTLSHTCDQLYLSGSLPAALSTAGKWVSCRESKWIGYLN